MLSKNINNRTIEASEQLTRELVKASIAHGSLGVSDANRRVIDAFEALAFALGVRLPEEVA